MCQMYFFFSVSEELHTHVRAMAKKVLAMHMRRPRIHVFERAPESSNPGVNMGYQRVARTATRCQLFMGPAAHVADGMKVNALPRPYLPTSVRPLLQIFPQQENIDRAIRERVQPVFDKAVRGNAM